MDFKNIKTFQGLNTIRFAAAFLVVMHHGETIRRKNGVENLEWFGLFNNGGNAVTIFFVLSGFLITYLLLKEKYRTNNISIRTFYLKRILRIWPLYFLLFFIGTIALPILFKFIGVDYEMPYTLGESWFYFVFFLPGLVTFYWGHHFLEPLWSIGVEECFYLLWAPLFKFVKKNIFHLLVSVIVIKLLLRFIGLYFPADGLFNYIVNTFLFEAMAIGGLGAYYVYTNGASLQGLKIFKIPFQIVLFTLLAVFLTFNKNIQNPIWDFIFRNQFYSPLLIDLLFLYLIICVSLIPKSIIKLNNRFLSYLGEISYGIYMYHMLVIFTIIFFLKKYLLKMGLLSGTIVFYSVVAALTILVAALSKSLFENYFLNMKDRLTKKLYSRTDATKTDHQ